MDNKHLKSEVLSPFPILDGLSDEEFRSLMCNINSIIFSPKKIVRNQKKIDKKNKHNEETYKTKPCVYWETTGSCLFGEKCTFAHGVDELRPLPNKKKE